MASDTNGMIGRVKESEHGESPSLKVLYHYTSYDSLIKIFAAGSIWASNILYLNDGSEFNYAYDILLNALTDVASRTKSHRTLVRLIKDDALQGRATNVFVA